MELENRSSGQVDELWSILDAGADGATEHLDRIDANPDPAEGAEDTSDAEVERGNPPAEQKLTPKQQRRMDEAQALRDEFVALLNFWAKMRFPTDADGDVMWGSVKRKEVRQDIDTFLPYLELVTNRKITYQPSSGMSAKKVPDESPSSSTEEPTGRPAATRSPTVKSRRWVKSVIDLLDKATT